MTKNNNILVIIPAYNEAESIVDVVENIKNIYPSLDYVIVNDGSIDGTKEMCEKREYHIINLPVNVGLGGAFQSGIKYALYNGYEYAVQLDGDGQHDPTYIEDMYKDAQKSELDIIIGSRYLQKKRSFSGRMIGSRLLTGMIFCVTGKKILDPTSGMRMYSRRLMKVMANYMNFDPEPDTVAYLIRCGAKVGEYPVEMKERVAGESYLTSIESIKYMGKMISSLCFVSWLRKKVIL